MTTKPKAQPIRLTFDGWGFNDLDDKFRSRFATLYPPLPLDDERCEFIVRAVNSHAALVEVLERILPNIGWRSLRGDDPNLFYCEFCAESDPDWRNIPHHDECAVYAAVAALAAAKGTK